MVNGLENIDATKFFRPKLHRFACIGQSDGAVPSYLMGPAPIKLRLIDIAPDDIVDHWKYQDQDWRQEEISSPNERSQYGTN